MYKFLLIFLISNIITAQQQYKGFVCDSISKLPLKHVEVFTNYESTLTNESGEFDLKTKQKFVYVKTVFMGVPKVVSLENFKTKDTLYLSPNVQLKEVVVTARQSILKQVVANISKNYNTEKEYKTDMFTHSNVIVNNEPKLFIEVVSENTMNFEIDTKKTKRFLFGKNRNPKTNILGLRKKTNGEPKFKSWLGINNIIDWSIDPITFLNKGVKKIEDYEDYYVLHYEYSNNIFYYSGWFSVNKEDYAIIENYERKESQWGENNLIKYNVPKLETSHIFYDKKEGFPYYTRKLLLVHQEFYMSYNEETNTIEKAELNFKMFNSNPTFEFNEIPDHDDDKGYHRRGVPYLAHPYDEAFWKNYNIPTSDFENSELYQDLKTLE